MPTLTQPAIGSTAWGAPMNTNLQVLQNQLINAMQGRIQRDTVSPTTKLVLQRYAGDTVEVNGLNVSLGSSGIALNTTDNLITATGADSGGAMGASTLYYLYVSNSSASTFPSSLRASATAYTLFNGIRYLGASGNAANWRFVGWVRTDGSTTFQDGDTQRFVVNYYNRRQARLFSCPGYVDNSADTSWTNSSTTWVAANGGTGSKLEYVANGEDAIHAVANAYVANGGNNRVAIEEDTANNFVAAAQINGQNIMLGCSNFRLPPEGYRYEQLMVSTSSGTSAYFSDFARNGASADPVITAIYAMVMV